MFLPSAGCEYAYWTVTGAPVGAQLEVTFDLGATWHPTIRVDDTISALLAGPNANPLPLTAISLVDGTNTAWMRLRDTPEYVIRSAGAITVLELL